MINDHHPWCAQKVKYAVDLGVSLRGLGWKDILRRDHSMPESIGKDMSGNNMDWEMEHTYLLS